MAEEKKKKSPVANIASGLAMVAGILLVLIIAFMVIAALIPGVRDAVSMTLRELGFTATQWAGDLTMLLAAISLFLKKVLAFILPILAYVLLIMLVFIGFRMLREKTTSLGKKKPAEGAQTAH